MGTAPPPYHDYSNYPNQAPQMQQPPLGNYQQPPVINYQPPPQVTVVTQQPGVVHVQTIPVLGPLPVVITCNNCLALVTTRTSHEISTRTHCCALGLCLIGLWPCIVFPYVCGGCCQRTVHTCSNCNTVIGHY